MTMLGLVVGDGGEVVRIDGEELVQASTVMATVTKGASSLLSMIITINVASPTCRARMRLVQMVERSRPGLRPDDRRPSGAQACAASREPTVLSPKTLPCRCGASGTGPFGSVRCEGVRFRAVVARRQDGSRTGQSALLRYAAPPGPVAMASRRAAAPLLRRVQFPAAPLLPARRARRAAFKFIGPHRVRWLIDRAGRGVLRKECRRAGWARPIGIVTFQSARRPRRRCSVACH
jgi:hypothetical protein